MSFLDLQLKKEYGRHKDKIVNDFYIPLLSESTLYKRSVGYFSSNALYELSYGITNFIKNDGKLRIITSPHLDEKDIEAINKGYELRNEIITKKLIESLSTPKNYFEEERLNIIANLIADNKLDIKIAFSFYNNKYGLYHEKLGLLYDKENNIVAFSGSMNETENAFSNNYEIVDVFTSWDDSDRVKNKELAFDNLWYDVDENAKVFEFDKAVKLELFKYRKGKVDYDIDKKEFSKNNLTPGNVDYMNIKKEPKIPEDVQFREYQKDAINKWCENNYRGIFDMATGTGKTYTALGAITKLYEDKKKVAIIIVCPYQHLVEQWVGDIKKFNMSPIVGYSSSRQKDWKERLKTAIKDFKMGIRDNFCFVTTNKTYSSNFVSEQMLNLGKDTLLLIDEAHNFGATNLREKLYSFIEYRLGLSATLERHYDIEGTKTLKNYFGEKCIEYDIKCAIREGFLVPYYYYPILVYLNDSEYEEYVNLSYDISKECRADKNGKLVMTKRGEILLLKRSRKVAGAVNKIYKLKELMECENKDGIKYKNDNHMLIYCGATKVENNDSDVLFTDAENDIEGVRQIEEVSKLLGNDLDMKVQHFTANENIVDRKNIIGRFEGGDLQAIIAIKCLDEGVNIPDRKSVV